MKTLMLKGLRRAVLAMVLSLFTAQAYGAEMFYIPLAADVSVNAGSSKTVPLTVGLTNIGRDEFRLYFLDSVTDGNLPMNWIQVFPTITLLGSFLQSDSTDVTVSVPTGTPPGTYSGRLQSLALGYGGPAVPGTGLSLTVKVASRCSAMPAIDVESFGPKVIWPPNHRTVTVNVSGIISVPDGCTLSGSSFLVKDEYGKYSDQGAVATDDDGNFQLSFPVEAARNGDDPDGRTYTISLMASDDFGGTTTTLNAVVPHDKKGK